MKKILNLGILATALAAVGGIFLLLHKFEKTLVLTPIPKDGSDWEEESSRKYNRFF